MSLSNVDEFQRYLFEYKFDGAEWGVEIKAASPNEALERLKAISWAKYKGEIYATVPVASARTSRTLARLRAAVGLG
ncbi:conserved hypothetical protein [Nitrobacter winogradskyi Nb-255]|uniref:Uncharacterized protein n=1 Tax=Nitrobacter winogradskyi (strain ATCC 25391 / DSM 10237 / CIP 104748 / NCIMB 11846 / Nb-255) TaxID=323098 RepID=Q3ST53_NITWN|nr:conserved hypothetical protein [Nitrobacter winogradskyi Nb-255]